MLDKILYSTSVQKVLSFLLSRPEDRFYDREVSRLTKVGRAATNYSLRALIDTGLVFTIYDYKSKLDLERNIDWHIGGKQKLVAELVNFYFKAK